MTGVLLSEPGQLAAEAPGKDQSGRKAPWIAQPALRMRQRIAPGASRVSAAVLRAAGPNEPHNESRSGPLRLVLRVAQFHAASGCFARTSGELASSGTVGR
jgi:hypothetical protein